ncbi:MAG: outer membrane lipoprotein carrier protein LolA [Nonlabens sp.]
MKYIFLSVVFVLAFAKAGFSQSNSEAKADALLQEVAQKFKSYDNLSFVYKGNFKNTKSNINTDIQGDATLSGEKYNVNYMGTTFLFDGNKQYVINREDEQVTISKPASEDDGITPSNILSFYEKGYTKKWDIEQNIRGRKIQFVQLTPIKSNTDYKNVLIGIDVNTKHIYNVIITEKSGTIVTFTLKSLKVNEPLAKNCFSFDESDYPDFDIEQLD